MRRLGYWVCFPLAGGLVLILLGNASNDLFRNDEVVWIDFFVRDLFSPFHLSGWNLAWNPYFVPDVLLYCSLVWIKNPEIRLGLYAIGIAALSVVSLAGIIRKLGRREPAMALAGALAAYLLFVLVFYDSAILNYSLVPVFHGGSTVLGLFSLYLVLRYLEHNRPDRSLALLFAVFSLGTFSDGVLLYGYAAPLVISLLLTASPGNFRAWRRLFLTAIAASLLGFVARQAVNRFELFVIDQKVPFTLDFFGRRLLNFFQVHFRQFIEGGLPSWGLIVMLAGSAIPALFTLCRTRWKELEGPSSWRLLAVFLVVAPLFAASFYMVFIDPEIMVFRALSIVTIPFLLGAAFFFASGKGKGWWQVGMAILACAVMASIRHQQIHLGPQDFASRHVEMLTAFDRIASEEHLDHGYAKPEVAKLLTRFSNSGVFLNQYTDDLLPHHYVDNLEWYVFDKGFATPCVNFIIHTSKDQERIVSKFGPPRASRDFLSYTISIYDRESDLAFRSFMKAAVFTKLHRLDKLSMPIIRELRRDKRDGVACTPETCIYIHAGQDLPVVFAPAASHDVLQISLAGDSGYHLRFFDTQGRCVHEADIAKGSSVSALTTHYLKIPRSALDLPVTSITVSRDDGSAGYSIGAVFMYDDWKQSGEGACATP